MRDVDKSVAQILSQLLELDCALLRRAGWPGLNAPKNNYDDRSYAQRDQSECERPGDAS